MKQDSFDWFNIDIKPDVPKEKAVQYIKDIIQITGDELVEVNSDKPWGAYFRFNDSAATNFIKRFFSDKIDVKNIYLDGKVMQLSPKILLVVPEAKLSWQYHNRRAECWAFCSEGAYVKSRTDFPNKPIIAKAKELIQIYPGERHRLIGGKNGYTVVAEIWQHTDKTNPSNEEDIVRLLDDYQRNV